MHNTCFHRPAGSAQRTQRSSPGTRLPQVVVLWVRISAAEAERIGLISRVVPAAELMHEATSLGREIAAKSQPVVAKAKECVNRAFESGLSEGLRYEKCACA
jgi:enoyl-CoA hydratase